MEHYYFVVTEVNKEGPFKLNQLKEMKLPKQTQVWRNDFSDWKSIVEVEELVDYIYTVPPKTVREIKIEEFKIKFFCKIKLFTFYYIIFSILLSIFSFIVAFNSWESFQKTLLENK